MLFSYPIQVSPRCVYNPEDRIEMTIQKSVSVTCNHVYFYKLRNILQCLQYILVMESVKNAKVHAIYTGPETPPPPKPPLQKIFFHLRQ